ncbi:endoplasmic reticulum protein SC65-like [Chanos chanos]|uniref:Endoplasmic reticulum protein SC65-like n=1 Tax=Chanos chanos TaxID=29144 RepID=A0A6J2VG10_CHACN|nr:endoplasmic reticulum protein SC65-like [Chanos chanos]
MRSRSVMLPRDLCAERVLLSTVLCASLTFAFGVAAHSLNTFESFLQDELFSIEFTYGQALDNYVAENWRESVTYLELSIRLYRHLKDSVEFCSNSCRHGSQDNIGPDDHLPDLQVFWQVLLRASCVRKCKLRFPVFVFLQPRREILDDFERRTPYKYLHYAYHHLNDTENAASAAHTFLQRNPGDLEMTERMRVYKDLFDLDGFLTDREERQYERSFLRAVLLFNSGDFSSSSESMEGAMREYLLEYDLCTAGCEGTVDVAEMKDSHTSLADACIAALRCKVKCEDNLTPNVGGYFVEKFMATMYHYLQFAYYKLNDARAAAPCASSYMLFDPGDEVMRQNMQYYHAYSQEWGLQENHFMPRPEGVKYFNQTTLQRRMLEYAETNLQYDDEDVVRSDEMTAIGSTESPDVEFEGTGDYEEGIYAEFWQTPKCRGDMGENDG